MLSVHSDFLMHPILILTHIHIVTATNGALHEEEQSSVTKKNSAEVYEIYYSTRW